MAVREFDGVDDRIQLALGACGAIGGGACTIAFIISLNGNDGAPWYLGSADSMTPRTIITAFGHNWLFSTDNSNFRDLGVDANSPENFTDENWTLVAVTKANGTVTPRGHKYVYSTVTWQHVDANGTSVNSSISGPAMFLGRGFGDAVNGRMAVVGVWDRALTDLEVEGLASSLQAWVDETPVGLWPLNQDSVATAVEDITGGGADQSAITGTTVVTGDDPPGFDFTVGGGGVTGSLAGTLSAATADLSGALTVDGALSGDLPALTADLSGAVTVAGDLGGTLPAATADLTGVVTVSGVLDVQLPALAADLAGAASVDGDLAGALPTVTADLIGENTVSGSLSATLSGVQGDLAGTVSDDVGGALASTLPALEAVLAGEVTVEAIFASSLPAPLGDITGTVGDAVAGSLNGTLPAPTGEFSGQVTVNAQLAGTLATIQADLAGLRGMSGALSGTLPLLMADLTGSATVAGPLSGTLPLPVVALTTTPPVVWPLRATSVTVERVATAGQVAVERVAVAATITIT